MSMASSDNVTGGKRSAAGGLWGRLAVLALILGALAAAWRLGALDYLSLDTLRERREGLTAFVAANRALALAAFVALYALVTALALPGALWVTIAGGFLFGLAAGSLATIVGATAGATILFLAARYLLADALRARAGPFLQRIEAGFKENAVSYLLTLRLVPIVPFFVANVAPAFVGACLSTFVATTAVGIIPGVIAYTWIGAGLGAAFDAGRTPDLATFARQLAPAFAALALLALSPAIYQRFVRKTKSRAG
jgi:uncharacterized membrane protein YdjX (TVP38/TMEM64 family)